MKRKYFAIIILLVILGTYTLWAHHSKENDKYDLTTEILTQSAGWKNVTDMSKYVMTVENFTGAWVAAKDSDFNIPGFQDNISTEFTFAAGNWETQNTNGKVVMYKGEVVDLQNVLPENVRMICTIAYYNEQVCLARIYPIWEDIFGNEFSLNDLASIDVKRLSWPITAERADIQKDLDYVKDTLSK